MCWRNLGLMHEIIDHGSGTYDTGKYGKYGKTDDPVSVQGRLGSALEEQRADLTALVFVDNPKLVETGAGKDAAEAKLFRQLGLIEQRLRVGRAQGLGQGGLR
jgi:hypothetical protein